MLTHPQRILRHLEDFGSITSMEAFEEYGNTRLSATIFKLREKGYPITSEWETAHNRYDEPVRYVRYRLEASQ